MICRNHDRHRERRPLGGNGGICAEDGPPLDRRVDIAHDLGAASSRAPQRWTLARPTASQQRLDGRQRIAASYRGLQFRPARPGRNPNGPSEPHRRPPDAGVASSPPRIGPVSHRRQQRLDGEDDIDARRCRQCLNDRRRDRAGKARCFRRAHRGRANGEDRFGRGRPIGAEERNPLDGMPIGSLRVQRLDRRESVPLTGGNIVRLSAGAHASTGAIFAETSAAAKRIERLRHQRFAQCRAVRPKYAEAFGPRQRIDAEDFRCSRSARSDRPGGRRATALRPAIQVGARVTRISIGARALSG